MSLAQSLARAGSLAAWFRRWLDARVDLAATAAWGSMPAAGPWHHVLLLLAEPVVWFPLFVPAFAGLARLQSLDLSFDEVSELPDGPYLESRESLDLACNAFTRVRATGLRRLFLSCNDELELADEDLELFGKLTNLESIVSACLNVAVELIRDRHTDVPAHSSHHATCWQACAAMLASEGDVLWPHAGAHEIPLRACHVDAQVCGCAARPTVEMQLDRRDPGRWQIGDVPWCRGSRGHAAPHACMLRLLW